jgi:hypothetical protein
MKKINFTNFLIFSLIALFVVSCSNTPSRKQYNDDAVRIKPEAWKNYEIEPNTKKRRNASTLRGNVMKVVTYNNQDTTVTDSVKFNEQSFVYFLDSMAFDVQNPKLEAIPGQYIEFIGDENKLNLGKNWFENYNNPLNSMNIREVPIDVIVTQKLPDPKSDNPPPPPPASDCGCEHGSFSLGLNCPERIRDYFYSEVKYAYGVYNDKVSLIDEEKSREAYFVDLIAGYRFGEDMNYQIGLNYSTGIPVYNSITSIDLPRPQLMLHGKYNFKEIACIRPFISGDFGLSLDKMSVDLFKLNCSDCESKLTGGDLDLSTPLVYGLGAGLDIPVPGISWVDLSLDLGWRRIGVGQQMQVFGYSNVSVYKKVDMFFFKIGLNY